MNTSSKSSVVSSFSHSTSTEYLSTWTTPLSRSLRIRLLKASSHNEVLMPCSYAGCFQCGLIFKGWIQVFDLNSNQSVLCPQCNHPSILVLEDANHILSIHFKKSVFLRRVAFYALLRQLSFHVWGHDLPLNLISPLPSKKSIKKSKG